MTRRFRFTSGAVLLASCFSCTPDPEPRARFFAGSWGAESIDAGPRGHLNAESGLGDWPAAHHELLGLMQL